MRGHGQFKFALASARLSPLQQNSQVSSRLFCQDIGSTIPSRSWAVPGEVKEDRIMKRFWLALAVSGFLLSLANAPRAWADSITIGSLTYLGENSQGISQFQ